MKRDIQIFEPIFNTFDSVLLKVEAKNYKKDKILSGNESTFNPLRRVLIDEIDHAFFTTNINIETLKRI